MMQSEKFTPAAGRFAPTRAYDAGVALLTREAIWRPELVKRLSLMPGETLLDVGCGTGSLAILVKLDCPEAKVVGLDPDPDALFIAEQKAKAAGVRIEWRQGFARDAADAETFDKVVSSLVFHQVPIAEKTAGIAAMFAATKPGGMIVIGDYARQSRWHMRQLFRFIQLIDGRSNTQPNADGFLEAELERVMGNPVVPSYTIDTPTGTLSLFCVRKVSQ